ncbi:uncharacterized protein LOC144293967 isoform X2 [Canis aureus]
MRASKNLPTATKAEKGRAVIKNILIPAPIVFVNTGFSSASKITHIGIVRSLNSKLHLLDLVLIFYLVPLMMKNAMYEEPKFNPNHVIHNFYWSSSRGWLYTHYLTQYPVDRE